MESGMIRIDAGFFPRERSNRPPSDLLGACWWKLGMLRAISRLLGMPDAPV
jgi:hypothetical protein